MSVRVVVGQSVDRFLHFPTLEFTSRPTKRSGGADALSGKCPTIPLRAALWTEAPKFIRNQPPKPCFGNGHRPPGSTKSGSKLAYICEIEPNLRAGWADATIGFGRSPQATEAHAALHVAVCHGREYNRPVILAKVDFRKAFDKCRLGKVPEAET